MSPDALFLGAHLLSKTLILSSGWSLPARSSLKTTGGTGSIFLAYQLTTQLSTRKLYIDSNQPLNTKAILHFGLVERDQA